MLTLYHIAISAVVAFLKIFPFGSLGRFIQTRKILLATIRDHYGKVDRSRENILIHVSSFGELEQAKPIITELKHRNPSIHIHLTFFSPSGYENAISKYKDPDIITYLPLDTRSSVREFLDIVCPNKVVFIRYDVWPILIQELTERRIWVALVCATLNQKKLQNPITRGLFTDTYKQFDKILANRPSDATAFAALDISAEAAGDTRFDQVLARKELAENNASLLPEQLQQKIILVAGSTWEDDERLLAEAALPEELMLIIVPHKTDREHLAFIKSLFGDSIFYSAIDNYQGERTIIVDSIGKLFELYKNGQIAYVGGGFGAGVHNVLEPAVWGLPVMCGPKIERSLEIAELIAAGGCTIISDAQSLSIRVNELFQNEEYRESCEKKSVVYVAEHSGAVEKAVQLIDTVPPRNS